MASTPHGLCFLNVTHMVSTNVESIIAIKRNDIKISMLLNGFSLNIFC